MEIYTRSRGGEDTCPRCLRNRRGALGPIPLHTCRTHESAGQIATRRRAKQLAQLDRRQR
jgi:hypothetical protein